MQIPQTDKPIVLYDLEIIISVGYRVKSMRGVMFRRWANSVLKQYQNILEISLKNKLNSSTIEESSVTADELYEQSVCWKNRYTA